MDAGQEDLIVADAAMSSYAKFVRTPLEMIQALERGCIRRVVLLGKFARESAFAAFLRECFPSIDVVVGDRPQAAYA